MTEEEKLIEAKAKALCAVQMRGYAEANLVQVQRFGIIEQINEITRIVTSGAEFADLKRLNDGLHAVTAGFKNATP